MHNLLSHQHKIVDHLTTDDGPRSRGHWHVVIEFPAALNNELLMNPSSPSPKSGGGVLPSGVTFDRKEAETEAANDKVKRKRSKLSLSRKQRKNWRDLGDSATSRVSLSPPPPGQQSATSAARPDIVVIDLNDDDDHSTATAATHTAARAVGQARRTQPKPRASSSTSRSKDSNSRSMNTPTSSETESSAALKFSHRSSAYVQHIAEACTLIMKDGRWQTCKQGTASRPLFQWESGDDLSAVRSFMSMHDDTGVSHGQSEVDEVFERALHLYSRMYHRKGPWFDLADLYIRYYAPSKETAEGDGTRSEFSSADDAVSPPQEQCNITSVESVEERGSNMTLFAPKPRQRTLARRGIDGANLAKHQSSLTFFFQDLLRLFSLGLVRTFASEQECGAVAGNASTRRGLLSADERREVLSSLGAKTHKPARKSLPSLSSGSTSTTSTLPLRNKILQQMRSQQTLSFSSSKQGRLLPVIKHVNRVLMRKMAIKVASSILPPRGGFQDTPRKAEVDLVAEAIRLAWETASKPFHQTALGHAGHAGNTAPATLRLREAPLKTLRRVLRLFYIAGGGPGAMRGDGSNCWLSVLDRGLTDVPRWQTVHYPVSPFDFARLSCTQM